MYIRKVLSIEKLKFVRFTSKIYTNFLSKNRKTEELKKNSLTFVAIYYIIFSRVVQLQVNFTPSFLFF